MIYDGHAYCFPDQRCDGGFEDTDEFRRHLQLGMAGHFQSAWRVSDRAPADSSGLTDLSVGLTFDGLRNADFRPAGFGRFDWTVEGINYAKQVMPPSVIDMAYSAEDLVAEMDYANVDRALLHRTPYLGISNDFIADCVHRFPDRLQGLAYVEEWQVQPEPDACISKLERAVNELGLVGLQFLTNYLRLYGQMDDWDSPGFHPFWDKVAGMNIPIFFTLDGWVGARPSETSNKADKLAVYLNELRTMRRWMTRYPDVKVVLTHGFNWRAFMVGDTLNVPDKVFEAAPIDNPNFNVQIMFAIALGKEWDYPMPQVRPVFERLVTLMGAERLMWGTDIPMVLRHFTYRQSLDHIRFYCDFLSDAQKSLVFGGNTTRLLNVNGA